jgi:hypothetical protein
MSHFMVPLSWNDGFISAVSCCVSDCCLNTAKKRNENACGSVAFCTIKMKWGIFVEDLQNIIPDKFGSTGQVVSKEKIEIWKVY